MATPTLYQHVSHSNVQGNTVTTYQMRLPNPSLSGNCIIVGINRSAAGVAPTITDDKGNTYTSLGSSSDGNQVVHLFAALNVTAGAQNLTVTFGTATNFVSGMASEFFNVATASAKDTVSAGVNPTTGTGSSTSIATAAFTPSTSGDLLYQFGIQDTTSSPITSFTQGSSPWKLLSADIFDSTFAQYQVQAAAASITPTATMSPTNAWNTICVALKSASAGTAPTGMYIQRCQHNAIPAGSGSPVHTQFPCSGNLLVMSTIMEPSLTITAVADGNSNTYSNTGTAFSLSTSGNVRHFYVVNPTTTSTMTGPTFTFTGSPISGSTVVAFDIVGASTTSPYDSTAGRSTASGTQASAGSFSGAALAPSRSGGIIFSTLGVESNTIIAVSGGGFIFLASSDNPEVSPWPNDQNNGWADVPNAPASSATPSWTSTGGGAGNWANVTDAFLPPAPLTLVVDSPEQLTANPPSVTTPWIDAHELASSQVPTPPRSQQFEEGEVSRNYDWRLSSLIDLHETLCDRAPAPPNSQQFEEGEASRSFDWSVRVDDSIESFRVPTAPFSEQEDYDLSFWRDYCVAIDDGLESQKLPTVIAVTPTAADETFEARSWDWRSILDDSTESFSAPSAPITFHEDSETHRWTDTRATFDDGTETDRSPNAPVSLQDDSDLARTFDRVLIFQDEDFCQKTPPVIVIPTPAIDDSDSVFAALKFYPFYLEDESSNKVPPPPPVIFTAADNDVPAIDWTGYTRLAAALEQYDALLIVPGINGPFIAFAGIAIRQTLFARPLIVPQGAAQIATFEQLVASQVAIEARS